jgi:hypothetical protein
MCGRGFCNRIVTRPVNNQHSFNEEEIMQNRTPGMARALIAAALLAIAAQAQAVTEIQWWHAMTGANNDRVNALAKRFSDSQSEYKVTAVYKGSYPEAMAGAIAAYRAGNAPALLQVFEVGTGTMMAAKGAIKPVYEVMAEAGEKFDPKAYVPAVAGYYTNTKGQMLSFPFQLDDGVLVQQGRVRESGARSRARAADVAGSRRRDGEAQGLRACLPIHDRLADLDAARKLLGLAQRALPYQGQRLLRLRCQAGVQRTRPDSPHREHAGLDQEGLLRLRRAQERTGSQVL